MSFQKIGIKNFRAFNGAFEFDFAPVTILTGTNSSGKSSLTKAMLLLKESVMRAAKEGANLTKDPFGFFYALKVNESLNLGGYDSWLNDQQKADGTIRFCFPFHFRSILEDFTLELTYKADQSALRRQGQLTSYRIFSSETNVEVFKVSAESGVIDLEYLWRGIDNFTNGFLFKLFTFKEQLVSNIDNLDQKLFTSFYDSELDTSITNDYVDSMIIHFLQHDYSFFVPDYDYEITFKKFYKMLSSELINEFLELREQTKKLDLSIYIQNPFVGILGFFGKVYPDFPLLTYDIVNKPAQRIIGGSVNDAFLEHKSGVFDKLSIKEGQEDLLQDLRRQDLADLSHYVNKEWNKGSNNISTFCFESLLEVFKQANQTVYFFKSVGSISVLERPGVPAKHFEYSRWKQLVNENSPIANWLLFSEEAEAFEKRYNYKSNLDAFTNYVILGSIEANISNIIEGFKNLTFIPPFRNTHPNRSYNLGDSQNHFSSVLKQISQADTFENSSIFKTLRRLVQILKIADDVELSMQPDGATVLIQLIRNGIKKNLADYGHGIGQLLPALMEIVVNQPVEELEFIHLTGRFLPVKTFIVEEPEANLHPAIQSLLADVLMCLAQLHRCRFIVETHSEYMIRRLQVLTADLTSTVDTNSTQIHYFYPPDEVPEGEPQVYSITIEEDGSLSRNFGYGFFDESSRLNISLYQFSKSSKN